MNRTGPDPGFRARKKTFQRERWLLRLFEIVLTGMVVLVLISTFLGRAEILLVKAEKLAMEGVLRSIEASILHAAMGDLPEGRADPRLQSDGNPMILLLQPPANYLGELETPDPAKLPRGNWYFDKNRQLLVYLVAHPDYFETSLSGPPRARFRMVSGAEGTRDLALAKRVAVFHLESLEPFLWLDP